MLLATAAPTVAQTQAAGERTAQAKLPQGRPQLWSTLRTTRIGEGNARSISKAEHPPAIKAFVGRTLMLPGVILPLKGLKLDVDALYRSGLRANLTLVDGTKIPNGGMLIPYATVHRTLPII